jgi:hypothetical protein
MVGLGVLDLEPLNNRLFEFGYPTFAEERVALGGGGHAILGRWIIGAEGMGYLGRKKDAARGVQAYEVGFTAGSGFVNTGYLLLNEHNVHVYPFIGVGGGGMELTITERSLPTFDDVLAQPGRSSKLTAAGFLMQAGIGLDHLFIVSRNGRTRRDEGGGPVLGVRAGYVFAPFTGDWQFFNTRLAHGPEARVAGPYIRLVIGGGRRHRSR